jgi:hypothetical protein
MGLTSTTVTVTTTATLLAAADRGRRFIGIANSGGQHIHIGGAGVTVANGIRLDTNDELLIQQQHENDHTPGQAWYAICQSGSHSVGVTLGTEDATT